MKKVLLIAFLFSIFIISGCNEKVRPIGAEGKSENWTANVIYELKTEKHNGEKVQMLYNNGTVNYLNDNSPNKIYYEYVYPNGFPSGSSGFIEHLEEDICEFRIGGGGSGIKEADTYESLREKIDAAYILVKWEINNESYEEKIQLNVND